MALQILVIAILLFLVLPAWTVYRPPSFVVTALQRRFPRVIFEAHVPHARKVVALSIDDAPSPYTSEILEVLRRHDVTATFFVIGDQVAGREKDLEAIVRAGSELGNHAMHDEPSINLPSSVLQDQIVHVDQLINTAHVEPGQARLSRLFRPGSGVFSTRIVDLAEELEYKTVLGGIYPHDPNLPYPRINTMHILSSLRPGAIIICHDRRGWTVPMLEKVVPEAKRRGYEIVTVSRLLELAEKQY